MASFKEAFRAARKAHGGGGGVFEWNGKKYTTDLKEEVKPRKASSPRPKARPERSDGKPKVNSTAPKQPSQAGSEIKPLKVSSKPSPAKGGSSIDQRRYNSEDFYTYLKKVKKKK